LNIGPLGSILKPKSLILSQTIHDIVQHFSTLDGHLCRIDKKQHIFNFRQLYFGIILILFILLPFSNTVEAQQNPYEIKSGHPRLIMTKYNELALRFIIMENPLARQLKDELKKDADKLLSSKKIKYELDRRQTMLAISREYLRRIVTLSLAYRIFEEDKYSDKAIDFMLHACTFPNWNPQHFLDVAEMTAALAIGYDWNFYHMNLRELETIRNRIVEYGLKPGLDVYNNPDDKPNIWYKMNNNWNQVCAGGLVLGALAVAEDFPDLKNKIIYQAVKNLIPTIDRYEPEGVWFEGPAYWDYANSYLALMLSALNTSLEHDFGLTERQGLRKTALFYVNSISPAGLLFNFADASTVNPVVTPALFWFSKRYKQGIVLEYQQQLLSKSLAAGSAEYGKNRSRLFYLSLPWFDDGKYEMSESNGMQYYRGEVDVLVFKESNDENALYLAAKGGKGTLHHQQLDAGSFVIDADGERWGIDLGAEHYFLPDFFDKNAGGGRWQYYRNTNKSHNTLVIGNEIQYPDGEAKLEEFEDQINQPFGIFDLSESYLEAYTVRRGFKILNADQVLIRDEVNFDKKPMEIRWGMMIDAKVELDGNNAILSKNGKRFFLRAYADEDVVFQSMPAKAYHKEAKDNAGKQLVYLTVNGAQPKKEVAFSVVLGRNMSGLHEKLVKSPLDAW
jgi:hypothetical protein